MTETPAGHGTTTRLADHRQKSDESKRAARKAFEQTLRASVASGRLTSRHPSSPVLRYKGYRGAYTFDPATRVAQGRILMERGIVVFSGSSLVEMELDMRRALDAYLTRCAEEGIEPNPPAVDRLGSARTSRGVRSRPDRSPRP